MVLAMRRAAVVVVVASQACGGEPCPHEDAAAGPSAPVARWEGGQLTLADLEARLGGELARMQAAYEVARYEKLHEALDAVVEEAVLAAAVRAGGHADLAALLRAEVDDRLVEPTDEELAAEFARFVEQMPGTTLEQARPYLRKQLVEVRRAERRVAFLEELKAAAGVSIDFPFPDIPRVQLDVRPDDPSLGPVDAPVTVVEFAGFECLYCRRMHPTMQRLVDAYPGKVRLVMKDFPLPGHGRAEAAAVAAHCAGDQDRYWEMADLLYTHQGRYDAEHLAEYAARVGLDLPRWSACVDDAGWRHRVEEDVAEGRRVGVQATPSFFFNGLPVEGAHTYERFAALVDQELARVAAADGGTR